MSAVITLEALDAPAHIARIGLDVRDILVVSAFYRDVLGLVPTLESGHCTLAAADGTVLVELVANPALTLAQPAA
ncbi:MAG: hypothetical protein ACRCUE_12425, partial [Bosea sp. (in: a-proteobacteria)]